MPVEQERTLKTVIECDKVSKVFKTPEGGDFEVIKKSFHEAMENEFWYCSGPGNAERTTLINLIAGFEPCYFR